VKNRRELQRFGFLSNAHVLIRIFPEAKSSEFTLPLKKQTKYMKGAGNNQGEKNAPAFF
jgi:hypothetical protein